MGVALQSTATSVNIKERLDFSCAIFDAEGALIANAPHIPVHLGSMGESIRTIIETRGSGADGRGIRRGDAYVLNDPYRGGTPLPDITVIVPVFYGEENAEPSAFVAARGHHADIGGIAPGSMPPNSRSIEEEGVLIDNALLVDEGRFLEIETRARLGSGRWPARNVDRNISDLKAQLAACVRGAEVLAATARDCGSEVIAPYMRHVLANAEESVRRLLGRLDDGAFDYEMDNGARIRVVIGIDKESRSATFDFSGTSAQQPDNFNAPYSIVRAASLYVVRTLVDDPIPMNDGCLRPIRLVVPDGCMMRGGTPATAAPRTRARGVRPLRLAASSEAMMIAAAPSLTPEALPAVTVPSARTMGLSLASASRVVARGCSSRSTITRSPLRCGISTPTISAASRPFA